METLDQLKSVVREWVKLDNEIRSLNTEIASRRNDKKALSEKLVQVMRDNNLDVFDLKDGQLMYVKKNKKKPITQKQLLTVLSTYFQDSNKAEQVHQFIMDNREETVEEKIQRKINK